MERRAIIPSTNDQGSIMIEALIVISFLLIWVAYSVVSFTDQTRQLSNKHQFETVIQ